MKPSSPPEPAPATEEQIEHDRTDSYLLGIAAGTEGQAGCLRVRAGEFYSQGKDELAATYRDIAKQLDEAAKRARATWEEHKARRP